MGKAWQLQEAKNSFSEVVEQAIHKGPQLVSKHGQEVVVILSIDDYNKLNKPKTNLIEFFQSSPLRGLKLDVTRSKETGRNVDL